MKKLVSFSMLFLAFTMVCGSLVMGQEKDLPATSPQHRDHEKMQMKGHDVYGIPGITEEQRTKIKDLRIASFKQTQPLMNQLGELKAHQHTLATAEKPDMKAIDANIDDITKVMNLLMKAKAENRQKVRALLTPEQRIAFDKHGMKKRGRGDKQDGFGNCPENEHHSENHPDHDQK